MYTPRAYAETDLAELDALFRHDPFVTLITPDPDDGPCISHLPVLYRRDAGDILIEGHWARPNPQARHAGSATLVVHGPHSYISPSWYVDKETAARVPTWNYAVAHLHGELDVFSDTDALGDLVARMSLHFEPSVGQDWRFEPGRDDHARQLAGIIGFRLRPLRWELKFKLNQNHPAANVQGAATALEALGNADAIHVAALMRDRLARRRPAEESN